MTHSSPNWPVRLKSLVTLAIALLGAMSPVARADWKAGYGQGALEYFSDKQDLRLYIACPTRESETESTSSVRLTRLSTGLPIEKFTMTVHGHSYDGPIESSSRVGSGNFAAFMQDLRKADLSVRYALGVVVYPKANAAKVIPPAGASFPCNTAF